MQHIKIFTAMLFVTLFFFGCKDSGTVPTVPEEEKPTITYIGEQPIPPSLAKKQTTLKLNGVMGTMLTETYLGKSVYGHAYFGTLPNTIDMGTVTVNNDTLYKNNLLLGNLFYTSVSFDFKKPRALDSLEFNRAIHTWNVSGNEAITGFQTSIQSPNNFEILQPTQGKTISKAEGISLEWSEGSNSTDDNVLIIISSISTDRTTYPPKVNTVFKEVPNTGKYIFSSNELTEISGFTTIKIVKFNHNITTHQENSYLVVSEIVKTVDVNVE